MESLSPGTFQGMTYQVLFKNLLITLGNRPFTFKLDRNQIKKHPVILASFVALSIMRLNAQENSNQLNPPFELPSGVKMQHDIIYRIQGKDTMHLDLFLPVGQKNIPAIIYVGASEEIMPSTHFWRQAAFLAGHGFVGATINYRRHATGEPRLLEAVQDVMRGVRWLREHSSKYGVDPSRIGLVGASDGGLIAALASTEFLPSGGGGGAGYSSKVQALVLLNPILDIRDSTLSVNILKRMEVSIGKTRTESSRWWDLASPIFYTQHPEMRHVGPHMPPILFLHGTADSIVPSMQSTKMAELLEAQGYVAETVLVKKAGHGFFDKQPGYKNSLNVIEAFFKRTLTKAEIATQWEDTHPSWSRDGSRIVFESDFGGRWSIWTMKQDGADLYDLGVSGVYPSWSPDGRHIAFADEAARLSIINSDGTGLEYVTRDSTESVGEVSWSPDGTHIAFLSWKDSHVYVVRLADRTVTRVENPTRGNSCPGWAPDGSCIILNSQREGQADLFLMNVDGSNPVRITNTPTNEFCPRISPDGKYVVFQRRIGSDHRHIDLMTIMIDGSEPVNLTDHPSNNRYATWSPDGKWIAFNSTRDGNSDIYVISSDGSKLIRLTSR